MRHRRDDAGISGVNPRYDGFLDNDPVGYVLLVNADIGENDVGSSTDRIH